MRRKRLDKFGACRDCLAWKIRRMVRERIDAYARYMRAEIASSDHIVESNKLIKYSGIDI
jgi:hypothetical protein